MNALRRFLHGRAKRVVTVACAAVLLPGAAAYAVTESGSPGGPRSSFGPERARALVAEMTLDEKLSFVSGTADPNSVGEAGFMPGVPRLQIPPLRITDGPAGVRIGKPATALPVPVALASSFNDGLAKQYGSVLGADARALGADVVLGPMMNAIRVPLGGRNFETFSEDPLVTSHIAAAEVSGIQSRGAMASVKHFAGNNQEQDRYSVDARIDDQALHEIELKPFKAAVDAGAASVLCSYNKVNGEQACGSSSLLTDILRQQLGFQGWVMSDWYATQSTDSLVKGLDQEMPDSKFLGGALKSALDSGTIPMSALDTAVTRIVTQMGRFGLLDSPPPARPAQDPAAGAKVARQVAEQGAVLLRNEGGTLPLSGAAGQNLALIGPTAKVPKVGGKGSSLVTPAHASSPLDTITARAGKGAQVSYSQGISEDYAALPAAQVSPRFPAAADGAITVAPKQVHQGTLDVPETGDYRFTADVTGPGVALLTVNGRAKAFIPGTPATLRVHLEAGKVPVTLGQLDGFANGDITTKLKWLTPTQAHQKFGEAVAAAKKAKTAVVFAYDDESEGIDRESLSLPDYQGELISAVADANPNTVVVLNTGSSVAMPWLGKTKAVLDMWYPGEQGAEATTRLLYGDVAPSGRLTQTFPMSVDQTPVGGKPEAYPGKDGTVQYSEGIQAGYRWYDKNGVRPLFPFGYGLTYTKFGYQDLSAAWRNGGLDVEFTLCNTGSVAGEEVPQVYLGASPEVKAPQATKALAGYQRVKLAAGASTRVKMHIDGAELTYWDTSTKSWRVGTGDRSVLVGPSAAVTPLSHSVRIR
ncbi:glycosyl hydrolase [Amycolatopsis sp. BJA-103]|nr:glycosyl hydrolase [Amycolatopsis sp. BJA-103]